MAYKIIGQMDGMTVVEDETGLRTKVSHEEAKELVKGKAKAAPETKAVDSAPENK